MKRSIMRGLALAAVSAVALVGCSSSGGSSGGNGGGASNEASTAPQQTASTGSASADSAPVTLTLAGWSFSTTPEFKTLADGFHAAHPNVTVQLKEYSASDYDTQMTADLAAGKAPDIYILKNLQNFITYQSGGQLMDVSDVASQFSSDQLGALSSYKVDGKYWAVPYRQDSWVLFYDKDLFDKAGVPVPNGKWTWDDYVSNAEKLTTALKGAGSDALGTYLHTWQSVVQGFAQAQK